MVLMKHIMTIIVNIDNNKKGEEKGIILTEKCKKLNKK